jgi:hypothetical protein
MQATITTFDNTAEGWERSLYAFLAEKERRRDTRLSGGRGPSAFASGRRASAPRR